MLILEIILTIVAWNRGWKWYSLIPVGLAMIIGLLIGIGIGANGGSANDVGGVIIIDIIAVLALIVMCVKKKDVQKEVASEKPASKEEGK